MKDYLKLIDTSTQGPRYDVTPLFGDFQAFSALLDDLLDGCQEIEFDTIAAIDALGFVLGAGMAIRTKKPLVLIRKGGKLPVEVEEVFFVDYTGERKSLEIRLDAIDYSHHVLVVDEWIETGAQVEAAVELIQRLGGTIAGIAAVCSDESEGVKALRERYALITLSKDLESMD
jgi:adenine phosphoribosyltransferase